MNRPLAYFYWDPSPELVHLNLPFLHRGILWYGFLFALGFFIGYWIFLYLSCRHFIFFPGCRNEDISLVSEWIRKLRSLPSSSPFFSLFSQLSSSVKEKFSQWKAGDDLPEMFKKELVKSCNAFIYSEMQCPQPRTHFAHRLLRFVCTRHLLKLALEKKCDDFSEMKFGKKSTRELLIQPIKKRLYLDEALLPLISIKKRSLILTERVTVYVVIGALIGSRLGDILFYQGWHEIAHHPFSIFKIWEGGLASHGGVIGIFISLWILSKRMKMSLLKILDLIVIPTALAAVCIRIGNFFNQEILGVPTQLPWGVIFGHPMDRESIVPRHPAQLYEAIWYGLVFLFLLGYFRRHPHLENPGRIAGFFFVLVFLFRFLIEFIKVEQSRLVSTHSVLTMGQWLSIPVILFGLFLLLKTRNKKQA